MSQPKQRPRGVRRKPIADQQLTDDIQTHPQQVIQTHAHAHAHSHQIHTHPHAHPSHPHTTHSSHHPHHHHNIHSHSHRLHNNIHPHDDTSSSEEMTHQLQQQPQRHRRQGSRGRSRRVPIQATEELNSTGEEDHLDHYQQQQHIHQQQQHIQHTQQSQAQPHIYPVTTDYYDADGHLITSEEVYYEQGDGGDGQIYDDGPYIDGGVYDENGVYDEDGGVYDDDDGIDEQQVYQQQHLPPDDDKETRGTRYRADDDDTSQTYNPDGLPLWVFLGGSCDPTTWRRDIAVPQLKAARIPFYNPQIDDWHPELIQNEARAKEECSMLLFVIDSKTRAIASMLEATEHIMRKRNVVLVILDVVEGTRIDGELVGSRQLKDLNRARAFLCDIAARHQEHCDVFDQVQTAIAHVIDSYPGPPSSADKDAAVPPLSIPSSTPTSTSTAPSTSTSTSMSTTLSQPSDSHRTSSPSLSPSPSPSESSTTPLMTATNTTTTVTPQPIHV